MDARRQVKELKRTLEVMSKRKKNTLNECKSIIKNLKADDLVSMSLNVNDYNSNVTKISRESDNRRKMLFPMAKLNTFVTFVNKFNSSSCFTIKWKEGKEFVEVGVVSVHIYHNPEESDDIIFTTHYNITQANGEQNKSLKAYTQKFNFTNDEVIRLRKDTDRIQSFASVGYVLLEVLCHYIADNGEIKDVDEFKVFFKQYSEDKTNNLETEFNFDNVLGLLSTNNIEDEKLMSINYL